MKDLLDTPAFGILLSIAAYEIGLYINRKSKLSVFNPLLIAIGLIITFLLLFHIKLIYFNKGGDFISLFLGPATVILAVPLYRQIESLKKNYKEIIIGILIGCVSSVASVIMLTKLFNLAHRISLSLVPKSITTPVGIEVSKQIGGIPAITVAAIILTGIIGSIVAPMVCRLFKITDKIAIGIAIGTSSHAVGTSKALEMGEVEGAMSGLAIGISALITVFISPLLIKLLQ